MTLAQSLTAIIVFWAIVGGLGASLLLPAMQSLIHGNFDGAARKKTYALVGAAAAIAAAVGPLLGGFVTTYLSWRVGFVLEVVIIAVVLAHIRMVRDVPYTGPRHIDLVGAALSVVGMGGVVLGILVWQEGGEFVGALIAAGARRARRAGVLAGAPQAPGEADADRPGPVPLPALPARDHPADAPADHPGRRDDRAADLLADDPRVQRDAGGALPRPAVAEHVRGGDARRPEGRQAAREQHRVCGVRAHHGGTAADHPARPPGGLRLVAHRPVAAGGIRAGPAGVPAQQLHAGPHRGGAGQRGRRGELGRGVVRAVVRPGGGGRHHAGGPLPELHHQDRGEQRDPSRLSRSRSPRSWKRTPR